MKPILTFLLCFLGYAVLAQTPQVLKTFQGHMSAVSSAAFSPDGSKVVTGSFDNTAKLWDLNGNVLFTFRGHGNCVFSVAFSPDGSKVLTASYDNTAKLWDLNGKVITTFRGHMYTVNSAVFSPDGSKVLTGSDDGTAKLWDLNGKVLTNFLGHDLSVFSVAFSPDGSKVLTGSDDETAKLWDSKGNLITTFRGHMYTVNSAVFSPDGSKVLTGSDDGTAKLWDLNGKVITTFRGHEKHVNSAVFSPDGSKVLTGSDDETAKLWDSKGNLITTFRGHEFVVHSAVFSPDGSKVLTGSFDNTASLWALPVHLRSKPALMYAPKPTFPPNLSIENPEVVGIGKNSVLDGGETATITATLKNTGKGTAYGLQPSLVGTIAGLSAKASTITSIEPGASAAITFSVTAPENLPAGSTELTIDVKEQNKFHPEPLVLSISTAPFVPPAPILADYKLADQEFIKLGQQAKVTGIIQNNSKAIAKAVRITITTPDNVFAASDAVLSLGDMQPNAKANFEFEFTANREFSGKVLSLALKIEEITGRFGAQETLKFNVNTATAGKKVVVIGPSGGSTESPVSPLASLTSDVDKDIPARKGGIVPNRYALIIGNEDYKGNQTGANAPESNVAFAKADALSFKRYAQNVLG